MVATLVVAASVDSSGWNQRRSVEVSGASAPQGQFMETKMRPLIRSLFLLSLAVAPLAAAANPVAETVSPTGVMTAVAADAVSVVPGTKDVALVESDVQKLEATIDGLRREVAQLQEREEARARVIGDPNNHSLWP